MQPTLKHTQTENQQIKSKRQECYNATTSVAALPHTTPHAHSYMKIILLWMAQTPKSKAKLVEL